MKIMRLEVVMVCLISLPGVGSMGCGQGVAPADHPPHREVLFFYDEHCPDCQIVRAGLLDRFLERRGLSQDSVEWLDVSRPDVVKRLLLKEKELGFTAPFLAPVVVAGGRAYCGSHELQRSLEEAEGPMGQ